MWMSISLFIRRTYTASIPYWSVAIAADVTSLIPMFRLNLPVEDCTYRVGIFEPVRD